MTIDDYNSLEELYFISAEDLMGVNDLDGNPEWTEESEVSEWNGRLQSVIPEKVIPLEDKPVRPKKADEGGEEDDKLKSLLDKAKANTEDLGIDTDALLERLMEQPIVKNTLQPYLDIVEKYEKMGEEGLLDPDTRDEKIKQAKEDYNDQVEAYKERFQQQIEDAIDEMSAAFKEIKLGAKNLSSAAVTIVNIGQPASPTAPPNPIKVAADILAYKNTLSTAVGQLNSAIVRFLKTAKRNKIPISDTIISTIDSALSVITTILNII